MTNKKSGEVTGVSREVWGRVNQPWGARWITTPEGSAKKGSSVSKKKSRNLVQLYGGVIRPKTKKGADPILCDKLGQKGWVPGLGDTRVADTGVRYQFDRNKGEPVQKR